MKLKILLLAAFASLALGAIIANTTHSAQWTFEKGIYLPFGWSNNYPENPGHGFPFTTENLPPPNCLCTVDMNQPAERYNAITYSLVIYLLLIGLLYAIKHTRRVRQ